MGCKNASVRMVAMAVCVMLMLMHNCVDEASAAASVEEEMELISLFSPPKSMAMGLREESVMASVQGGEDFVEEITRRMLASSGKFIANRALDKNNTPCSQRGVSYYNTDCNKPGKKPAYKRSCTAITKCSRGN